ncbi:unnamed protein product [Rhizoctonia solani]|uniref:Uncharacterized protein n=1 Tax=Rhizoctonia solani TaxID=456999 RepID=A0A8H3DE05_9AGAM|nr:unnamed protein product [Rhizoctonia solani]
MALEWSPVCNHMELILGDSRVYPLCINLVRSVDAQDRDILENAYGFMCLQFITLAMDIAKIAQNDRLLAFQEEISQLAPGHSIRSIMNNYSRELEGEGIWTCLPQIGGCGFKDTTFLLEQLWTKRELFLEAAQVAASIFPGWGGLFILATKELSKLCWKYISEIALRYAMCSEVREDPVVYVTINHQSLRHSLVIPDGFEPVDDVDAIQVATCTTRKLNSLSTINDMNLMASEIVGYASILLGPLNLELHVKQLFKAAFRRAWNELSAIHYMNNRRWHSFGVHYDFLIGSLRLLCKYPKCALAVRDFAQEWDLYELYAYILLFPISLLGRDIKATEHLPDDLEFEMGLQVLALKYSIIDSGTPLDPPDVFLPIWCKISSHILFRHEVLGDTRESKGCDMVTMWNGATRIFPYEHASMKLTFQCAYARCAAPEAKNPWKCGRCYLVIYFSRRCQQA